MKRDGLTLGWGMARLHLDRQTFFPHRRVELRDDGTACVTSATQDIGTGTTPILAQAAAEELQRPVEKVEVVLGDSTLPAGPLSGGSMVTASVIPAVLAAAGKATESLLGIAAKTPGSKLAGKKPAELIFKDGRVQAKDGEDGVPFHDILQQAKMRSVTGQGSSEGTFNEDESKAKFSTHSFGAHFVEVVWQPEIVRLRVNRVVSVIDAGRILNPLAGRNQIEGAVVMGIGMALFEKRNTSRARGAPINSTSPTTSSQ